MNRHAAILVTGMSGVGKSTALAALAQRGCATVDTDDGRWIEVIDSEPLWRETLIAETEPLLRRSATHEIETTRPLSEVVDILADIANDVEPGL